MGYILLKTLCKKADLKEILQDTLNDDSLKALIDSSKHLPVNVASAPLDYLKLFEIDTCRCLSIEEFVLRKDSYWINRYECVSPPPSQFATFADLEDEFPAGWMLAEKKKQNLEDIPKIFPYLSAREFKRDLKYAIKLQKKWIRDYEKDGSGPSESLLYKALNYWR